MWRFELGIDVNFSGFSKLLKLSICDLTGGIRRRFLPDSKAEQTHRNKQQNETLPIESTFSTTLALIFIIWFFVLHGVAELESMGGFLPSQCAEANIGHCHAQCQPVLSPNALV